MEAEQAPLSPLEPGQLWVMRIRAWMGGAVWLVIGLVAAAILNANHIAHFGLVLLGFVILMAYPVGVAPDKHYRAYRWGVADDELHFHRGVFTKVETIVPFRRVQHIDVSRSWLDRSFGVASLVLHTAGTMNNKVTVPGLSPETAERVRDEVRAVIAREADVH